MALARVVIRAKLNRRVYVDNGLFFLAVVTLITGTIMTYIERQDPRLGSRPPERHNLCRQAFLSGIISSSHMAFEKAGSLVVVRAGNRGSQFSDVGRLQLH